MQEKAIVQSKNENVFRKQVVVSDENDDDTVGDDIQMCCFVMVLRC